MEIDQLRFLNLHMNALVADLPDQAPDVFADLQAVRAQAVRTRLADLGTAVPEAAATLEAIDVDAVVAGGDVTMTVLEAMAAAGLDAGVTDRVRARLGELDAGFVADGSVRDQPLLADVVRQAELVAVSDLAGAADTTAEALVGLDVGVGTLDAASLRTLVDAGTVSRGDAAAVGLAATLVNLLDGDASRAAAAWPRVGEVADLAGLAADDWHAMLGEAGAGTPDGVGLRDYARRVERRVSAAMPTDALLARLVPADTAALTERLAGMDDAGLRGVARTFPGLGVDALLAEPHPTRRAEGIAARIGLVRTLRDANPDVELLTADLAPGGPGLEELRTDGVDPGAIDGVLRSWRAHQRVHALSEDPATTAALLASGYAGSADVVRHSADALAVATGLPATTARRVHADATAAFAGVLTAAGAAIDAGAGVGPDGSRWAAVDNIAPDARDQLRRITGYAELFGEGTGSRCTHCRSILSPAAYFVDLMAFVEQHVLDAYFAGPRATDELSLRVRRPDLWSLPLTCANTEESVPTLQIVDAILTDHIAAGRVPDIDLGDRPAVEREVRAALAEARGSFRQPSCLPLARLEAALRHLGTGRADVARALGAGPEVRTRAVLGLSAVGHGIVVTPAPDRAALRAVYGVDLAAGGPGDAADTVAPFDPHAVLGVMGVTRDELAELLATRAVARGGTAPRIRAERSPDGVAPDTERVHGATLDALDRLHRLTRLRACLPWTTAELDLVLARTGDDLSAATVERTAELRALQTDLGLSPVELCALVGALPPSLRTTHGAPLADDRAFLHPALALAEVPDADVDARHRLLAGLRVDDATLHRLVVGLAGPLGCDPGAGTDEGRRFVLSVDHVSLLYRHARLAELWDLPVEDLMVLVGLAVPGTRAVTDVASLQAVLATRSWIRASPYDLATVAALIDGSAGDHATAAGIAARVLAEAGAGAPADDLATRLAPDLGVDPAVAAGLLRLAGWDTTVDVGALAPLTALVERALPLGLLFGTDAFDAEALAFVAEHPGVFGGAGPVPVDLDVVRRLATYAAAVVDAEAGFSTAGPTPDPADVRAVLSAFTAAEGFAAADRATLARVLRAEAGLVATAQTVAGDRPANAVDALARLADVLAVAARLGAGGDTLALVLADDDERLDRAADVLLTRAGPHEPVEDELRGRRRDALVDLLVHSGGSGLGVGIDSRADLYRHLLVDVEMEGCARTTRIAAALGSVQLYVHRILLDLEADRRHPTDPDHVHVPPTAIPAHEWAWRRNYRVWEANRKVFLHPENYLEPDLRDRTSPGFDALAEDLLARPVDDASVLEAYATYLRGFEEVATLTIVGSWWDRTDGADVIHLVGATPTDPPRFHHRTVENLHRALTGPVAAPEWTAWRPLEVQIPVRDVAPVVHRGRLHLFWTESAAQPLNRVDGGASSFVGYEHRAAVRFTTLGLDGRWSPPQELSTTVEGPEITHATGGPGQPTVIVSRERPITSGATVRDLMENGVPRYSHPPVYHPVVHEDPRADYALRGPNWAVYPDVQGGQLLLTGRNVTHTGTVDLYHNRLRWLPDNTYMPISVGYRWLTARPSGDGGAIEVHTSTCTSLARPNAWANIVLDRDRFEYWRLERNFTLDDAQFDAALYPEQIATLPRSAVLSAVTGAIGDAVVQLTDEVLLVVFDPTAASPRYEAVRIGTTVAGALGEQLFTHGIDGLLATAHQLALAERPAALAPLGAAIISVPDRDLDYAGPSGVYLRELFLHIPVLIAGQLNARGEYAAAQRWYRFVFDPTASERLFDDVRRVGCGFADGRLVTVAVTADGWGWRRARRAVGVWEPGFADLRAEAGDVGAWTTLACAPTAGTLQVVGTSVDGRLWHTVRHPDGTWQGAWGDVEGQSGDIGAVVDVAVAGDGAALHLCCVAADGLLRHTRRDPNGSWPPTWTDVQATRNALGTSLGVAYVEDRGDATLLDGWLGADDVVLAGDFTGVGHHQVLVLSRSGAGGGRALVVGFAVGGPPATVAYREGWLDSDLLLARYDDGDTVLVGDFTGVGHDQVLFVEAGGGGLLVVDFATGGGPPVTVAYREDAPGLLDGWVGDAPGVGRRVLAGDFTGVGHDQVLVLRGNDPGGGTGGRLLVVDLAGGAPGDVVYREHWGESAVLDGWHDEDDLVLVGDFTGVGHDEVLLVNRSGSGGRVLVADLAGGVPPVAVRYLENWGDSGLFDGWYDGTAGDGGDLQVVGDFTGVGHDQLMLINRSGVGGRVLVADLAVAGGPPATVAFWENWEQSSLLDGFHDGPAADGGDLQLSGDFTGTGHDQVLFADRGGAGGRLLVADVAAREPRRFTATACAVVATTLHVVGLTDDGGLRHTRRAGDGTWRAGLDDVTTLTGTDERFLAVACGAAPTGLVVLALAEGGTVRIATRGSGGAWSAFTDLGTVAGDPGPARAVSASGDGRELHVGVVGTDGRLRHAGMRPDGTWRAFDDGRQTERDRVWRYREFRGLEAPRLREVLSDRAAIEAYRRDPFNPHAIARLRLGAYQKSTVMKYVDTLLDWGDSLFTEFTSESVNEATLLYVTAADILGPARADLGGGDGDEGDGEDGPARTYATIAPLMASGSEFLLEAESLALGTRATAPSLTAGGVLGAAAVSALDQRADRADRADGHTPMPFRAEWRTTTESWQTVPSDGRAGGAGGVGGTRALTGHPTGLPSAGVASFGTALLRQLGPVFCVPPNPELDAYRQRVEDRLRKIRNCQDITGARRDLAPFAPEIDPRLLVRARAAGVPTARALAATAAEVPPYRFEYLLERAKQQAATVASFGGALLAALEKKDAEELAGLRAVHEQAMLALATGSFDLEIEGAQDAVDALVAQKAAAEYRRTHYQALVETGRIPWEHAQAVARHTASVIHGAAGIQGLLVGLLSLIPQLGSPFAMKYGGVELRGAAAGIAHATRSAAEVAEAVSGSAGLEAGFARQKEEWRHQVDLADHELSTLEKQIEGARVRKVVAERAKTSHARSVAHAEEVFELFRAKFSALGLYTQLATALTRLHREAFDGALALARLAEQALLFERGDDVATLGTGQWDAARAGLLAGERLTADLQALERRHLETHHRGHEVTQTFSLSQIDPVALTALRETGECTFGIPELWFDLFYPGHYRRRIRAVRVTVPCVTGPYVNVSATLTLLDSTVRTRPVLPGTPTPVPLRRGVSIATSTAQSDGGVFDMSFSDPRYLPFEGHGAVSSWRLTLPRRFRPFDYQTISDVGVGLSYTAEFDEGLRAAVEDANAATQGSLEQHLRGTSLQRVLSLRRDFPAAFARLVRDPVGTTVDVEITDRHLPIFLAGRELQVESARLVLRLAVGTGREGVAMTVDDEGVTGFSPQDDVAELPGAAFSLHQVRGVHSLRIDDPADLGPDDASATTVDDRKLADVLLLLTYRLA